MSISNECMIVNLKISKWSGHVFDRTASEKINEDAGASGDTARVNKLIVPKEVLLPVNRADAAIRNHVIAKTLPWKDNGDRLLSRRMYMEFIEQHEKLVSEYNKAVDHLLSVEYPIARDKAEFRMGDLFDPSEFPDSYDLRRRYGVHLSVDMVPDAQDFRVKMDADHAEKVRASIEQNTHARVTEAMGNLWERLSDVLSHFAERAGNTEAPLYASALDKLKVLAEDIPKLNVTGDPRLDQLAKEITDVFKPVTIKEMRKDPEVREDAAVEADRIMATMKGFMTAMQNANVEEAA